METIRDEVHLRNRLEDLANVTLDIISDHFKEDTASMKAWLSNYNPYLRDAPSRMMAEGSIMKLLSYVRKYCI